MHTASEYCCAEGGQGGGREDREEGGREDREEGGRAADGRLS